MTVARPGLLRWRPSRTLTQGFSRRFERFRVAGSDAGMSTAEYAIGTVAACAFAGLLLKILTSPEVAGLLKGLIRRAFSFAF
jgi:Protein of unknown function (DUF4244)